jgi:hypothetical protein
MLEDFEHSSEIDGSKVCHNIIWREKAREVEEMDAVWLNFGSHELDGFVDRIDTLIQIGHVKHTLAKVQWPTVNICHCQQVLVLLRP